MSLLLRLVTKVVDGVYVDSITGMAGTSWPIGTPAMPVSNLTDAITIAAARKTNKIILANPSDNLTVPADMIGYIIIGSNRYYQISQLTVINKNMKGTYFQNLALWGTDLNTGTTGITCVDCQINLTTKTNSNGSFWNCRIFDLNFYTNADFALIGCSFPEDDYIICYIDTGKNLVLDCQNCAGFLILDNVKAGSDLYFSGPMRVYFRNSCTGGYATIYPGATYQKQSAAVTTSFIDYSNLPNAEVPVNIAAIVASETNFLNLAATDGMGLLFNYTIDDLVLKCADPGANTVNVKLYKLVNGVLTNIKTFAITNANFATYFDINTLFGLKSLAGDNIKITVQATAGGPYAVTGSYAYRSA
jgi:hypothetical protein